MPENIISATDFLREAWEDYNSPTTSTFISRLNQCKATVAALEETLDYDRSGLIRMKKAVKAVHSYGTSTISSDVYLAEVLERLGVNSQKEPDHEISSAFGKFAIITKELSGLMKNLMHSLNNTILFPLDSFLQNDFSAVRGDLKKPFEKAWKDYESKFNKIEKEKKQIARDAGMIKTEVTGAEIAEELERERQVLQFQMCEYLMKVNDIKTKKGVDLLQHFVDYYQAQTNFFQDGLKTLEYYRGCLEGMVSQLERLKQKQATERRNLMEFRDCLKERMAAYKEPVAAPSGYSLHQLRGNKVHGYEKNGFLLKKSEGKIKKVWQKRRCVVRDGILSISHSDTTKEPVKLNLLTCQVKLVPDDPGKKCFDLISSSKNRTYHFQADDSSEMEEWISVLNNAKELVLMKAFGEASTSSTEPYTQSVKELTGRLIQDIKRQHGNQKCCDCGAPGPEWLSVNLGVLICLECCGVHRDMGVHISRTQSIVIDELNVAQLLLALVMSNDGFNEIMEATLELRDKPTQRSSMDDRKTFIRNKYERRRYAIVTCADPEDRRADLKLAILNKDLYALLQVFVEGVDFMEPLPDMNRDENSLHLAIINEVEDDSSPVIVDFIVQNTNSQDLCRRTADGNTALHLCALYNRTESMKLLLRSRPDLVNYENNAKETAMDIASSRQHTFCVDLLKHAKAGKTDLFGNLNINWEFSMDDVNVECSDDELEASTPERKIRSRPPSLVLSNNDRELSYAGSTMTLLSDRSMTTDSFKFPIPFVGGRPKLSSTSDAMQSVAPSSAGLSQQRDSTMRKKAPPPPPPHRGHLRNPSDPGFIQLAGRNRSPTDPPPPLPEKVGRARLPAGAELVLPQLPAQTSLKPVQNARLSVIPTSKRSGDDSATDRTPPLPSKPSNLSSSGQQRPDIAAKPVDHSTTAPQQNIKSQPAVDVRKKRQCITCYKCVADNDDELSFDINEVITILNDEEEDWWEGEIEGDPKRRGMFPVVYVRILTDEEKTSSLL